MAEILDIDFWKKAQNRRFLGSPTSKIFFDKLSIKKPDTPKILVGTLRVDILGPIFEKVILRFRFESGSDFSFCGQITAEIKEKFWKILFEIRAQNPDD